MANAQLRLLEIVRHLPRYPRIISTLNLRTALANANHKVGIRTLQRDLQSLVMESRLGIMQTKPTGRGKEGVGYCFKSDAKTFGPTMDHATALTLVMASEYISQMMPQEAVQAMHPYVGQAEGQLNSDRRKVHAGWRNKVRSVPRYLCFQKPDIDEGVYATVTTALLEDKCIEITYKEREKPYLLHPLTLVDRGIETILVAYAEEYKEHRQFMLHRMRSAKPTTFAVKRPKDFDIDTLIETGYFSVPLDNKRNTPIKLKLQLFKRHDGALPWIDVLGTPLSADQEVKPLGDNTTATLTATVRDTQELRSWLLGLGAQLEVIKPTYLRRFIRETVDVLGGRYNEK